MSSRERVLFIRATITSLQGGSSNSTLECFDDNTAVEFIDGLLSPEQVAKVEKHAARCEACRRVLAELGRSPSFHRDETGPTLPAGEKAYAMLETGQKVGRFVIINRLGSGGMGVVFAAYDPQLDRKVALKLLRSPEDTLLSSHHGQMRLLREAQAIAQLSHHENVVTIYDYGTYESEVYIAMEFVEGETMTKWLTRWDRHWRDVLSKFLQAGRALAAAHAGGLVHRDFKPDNVLVGNDERVRVMDFGLARSVYADPSLESTIEVPKKQPAPPSAVRSTAAGKAGTHPATKPSRDDSDRATGDSAPRALNHPLTKTGTVLGTPRYMAPEQFSGVVADARSDQFSFCLALYEALYKQHPFKERTAEGLVDSPESTKLRPPPSRNPVPAWLHKALVRGMAGEPGKRFASMDALLREIQLRPLPQPRMRLAAPFAVAVLAIALAVYLFITKRDTETDLVDAHSLIAKLEKHSDNLNSQVMQLTDELRVVREELGKSAPAAVERLQQELAHTRVELTSALATLTETERELAQVSRRRNRSSRQTRDLRILSTEIREAIEGYRNDFEICFSEWRERSEGASPLYAVQLTIGKNGRPRANAITAGIEDEVVHDCVTGLFDKMRFRETDVVTVVQIGFRQEGGRMLPLINVMGAEEGGSPEPDGSEGER